MKRPEHSPTNPVCACGLLMIASLLCCGDAKPKGNPAPKATGAKDAQAAQEPSLCEKRSQRVAKGLLVDPSGGATSFGSIELPMSRSGTPITHPSMRVALQKDGLVLAEDKSLGFAKAGGLKRGLETALKLYAKKASATSNQPSSSIVLITADAAASLSDLKSLLVQLPKGAQPRLVVNASGPMDRLLEQGLLSQDEFNWLQTTYSKTEQAQLEWNRNIGTACKDQVRAAVSVFATAEPGNRMSSVAKEIPAAMLACECEGLGDKFEAVIFSSLLGQGRPARWLPLSRTASLEDAKTIADLVAEF